MNRLMISRIASVLAGAAVLFGLQHGMGVQFYYAFPAALVAYFVVKVGVGLALGVNPRGSPHQR